MGRNAFVRDSSGNAKEDPTAEEIETAKAKEDARRLVEWQRDHKRWAAGGGEGPAPEKPSLIPRT